MRTKQRVLTVDDDPIVCRTIERALSKCGFEVMTAQDGCEGVVMSHVHKPDLVILDIVMPKMDGYSVCTELQNDPFTSGIPILMLTSLSDDENVIHGLDFGADQYITKPFDIAELRERVKRLIIRSRSFVHTSARRGWTPPDCV